MSKLNPLIKTTSFSEERLAGGSGMKAAKQDNYSLLRRAVLANLLWEDNFYIDGQSISDEIARLIPLCDPDKVVNLAIEARHIQKLRHVPLFILVCMLKHKEHSKCVAQTLPQVITRADMITDFVAIYEKVNGHIKPLANAAKKGLAGSFYNFNEYAFAKYDRNTSIKLRDVMFLVRPKPRDQQDEALFSKIANRTLEIPDTWEVALSTGKNKKDSWTRLIEEGKLGALAFLRNIRNMMNEGVEQTVIRKGFNTINSNMLLPLNFLNALKFAPQFKSELNDMFLRTYRNIPKIKGKSIFILDVSGSMRQLLSAKSDLSRLQAGMAMVMLGLEFCEDCDLYITAGADHNWTHTTINIKYPARGFNVIDQIEGLQRQAGRGGIFTRQCLEHIRKNYEKAPERIIIFSDSQDMDRNNKVPNPFGKNNYIVDVSSEKRGVNFKGKFDAEITGFSEAFLAYIAALEGISNCFDSNQ